MAPPPGLPVVERGIVALVVHSDRQRRVDGHRLCRCGEPVEDWQSLLVQQWIPLFCQPFDKREKVPMHRVVCLAADRVSTDVESFDPETNTTPGAAVGGVVEYALVGIGLEREAHSEPSSVAREPLPGTHRAHPGPRLDRVWGVRGSSWKAEERQRAGRITTDVA